MTTTEHLARACARLARRCADLRSLEREKEAEAASLGRKLGEARAALADMTDRANDSDKRRVDAEKSERTIAITLGDMTAQRDTKAKALDIESAKVRRLSEDCGKAVAEAQRLRAELGEESGWRLAAEEAQRKLAEAERRLAEGTAFTYCAYCGAKFAADGEHATDDVSQHICTCQKHPMRQVEAQRDAEKARADANKDAWYKCADRANAAEREVERLRGEVDKAYARAPFDAAKLKAEVERLRGMLLDAIRYVESEYGARGELCGSAVNGQTYLEWVRATQREADAPPADAPNAEDHGRRSRTVQPLVGNSESQPKGE